MNYEYPPEFKAGCGIFKDRFDYNPTFYLEKFDHLEIQDFIFPFNLGNRPGKTIRYYKKSLKNFKGTLSLHGPFKELVPSSMDPEVRQIAYERFSKALYFGIELGCELMVVHSCYNPLMNYSGYQKNWLENSSYFWDDFIALCEKEEITVVLENIWDRVPDHLVKLVKRFNTPNLRVCFDSGHANIFSFLSQERWLSSLGDCLGHLHIHDNCGEEDEHLPPGQGNIDFSPFFSLMKMKNTDLAFVCEVQGFDREEDTFLKFFGR